MANDEKKFDLSNFFEKIKTNKFLRYLIIILLVILVFFVAFGGSSANDEQVSGDLTEYVISLENRLSNTLAKVDGAGEVKVVINVKSGAQTVLATKVTKKETSNGLEIEESPVIVNGKTVVLKELVPEISGVLIVAEGAQNIMVKSRLLNATKSLLNIDSSKIEILTMK